MSDRRAQATFAGMMTAALVWSTSSAAAGVGHDPVQATAPRPGVIDPTTLRQVREGLYVIEDRDHTPAVPNVGIVTGTDAILVVDTGIDRVAGEMVLAAAERIADGRRIYVTATHFHPEHAFGAVAFQGRAILIASETQQAEALEKRDAYVALFARLGMGDLVEGTRFVEPDELYASHRRLDLGGRVVDIYAGHAGHTRGDQIVVVPDLRTVFLGDLLETRSFPIFPWYPEIGDTDVHPAAWLATLDWVEALDAEIVVPGHGPVAGPADVRALRTYIAEARDQVRAHCRTETSLAGLQDALEPALRRTHPDWGLTEWIRPGLNAFVRDDCPSLAEPQDSPAAAPGT